MDSYVPRDRTPGRAPAAHGDRKRGGHGMSPSPGAGGQAPPIRGRQLSVEDLVDKKLMDMDAHTTHVTEDGALEQLPKPVGTPYSAPPSGRGGVEEMPLIYGGWWVGW